jgi:hypothetical protein
MLRGAEAWLWQQAHAITNISFAIWPGVTGRAVVLDDVTLHDLRYSAVLKHHLTCVIPVYRVTIPALSSGMAMDGSIA